MGQLLSENPDYRIGTGSADASVIGTTVHAVIAILAPLAEQVTPAGLVEVTLGLSRGLCAPGRMHRRNSILVAGFAAEYLRGVARPRTPWECIETEAATSAGVVDLVWRHRDTGLTFVDEVKTTQVPRTRLDKGWVDQAHRYAVAADNLWGDRFIGVRLVPLGSMHLAALIGPDGTQRPVAPVLDNPVAGVAS